MGGKHRTEQFIFNIVHDSIANISTDGLPHILFYLAGVTCWTYFAETLTKTSTLTKWILSKSKPPRST